MDKNKRVGSMKRRGTVVEDAAEGLIEEKHIELLEREAKKRTFGQKLISLRNVIYNPKYREFISRDGKKCCQLSFFFFVFYAVLGGFFIAFLAIFYQTLDLKIPTYYNEKSTMNHVPINPGAGFRPQHDPEDALIFINKSDVNKWRQDHTTHFDLFLQEYEENANTTVHIIPTKEERTAKFDIHSIIDNTPCSKQNSYGFGEGKPCIAIKLNKIYGWLPKAFSEPPSELNIALSDELKTLAASVTRESQKFIFVTCEGENSFDKDNIGEIDYYSMYPSKTIGGLPTKFYPYRNQNNYLSPLVFAHFKNITKDVLINIYCRLWAENIDNTDKYNQRGMTRFEIYVTE